MILKKFNHSEIKNEILKYFGKSEYNIVNINYEKKLGINIVEKVKDLFEKNCKIKLQLEDFDDFYKVYIFNEEEMITIYKFSDEDYRVSIIKYEYDNQKNILNYKILKEREIYLELELDKNNIEEVTKKEFKVKIQIITQKEDTEKKKTKKEEMIKFVEFID